MRSKYLRRKKGGKQGKNLNIQFFSSRTDFIRKIYFGEMIEYMNMNVTFDITVV